MCRFDVYLVLKIEPVVTVSRRLPPRRPKGLRYAGRDERKTHRQFGRVLETGLGRAAQSALQPSSSLAMDLGSVAHLVGRCRRRGGGGGGVGLVRFQKC